MESGSSISSREGVLSTFFGRPVSTNQGLALLALKSGAPVLFCWGERVGDGSHILHVGPVVEPPEGSGNRDEAVTRFTQAFDKQLEWAVRQRPEQWFWLHKRWSLPTKFKHLEEKQT